MKFPVQKPRGTNDCYGKELIKHQTIVRLLTELSARFGFEQIITPTFEDKNVFVDSLGPTSEVVHKEFFELVAYHEQNQYVLRPENTASIIRVVNNDKLLHKLTLPIKFYYYGSMFRYERPQAGRLREFFQYGLELIGTETILDQVEVFLLIQELLTVLNLTDHVSLQVNCLGDAHAKQAWNEQLKAYFQNHMNQLSPLSQQRVHTNPIRILDDKNDQHLPCVQNAPKIQTHLAQETWVKYQKTLELLTRLKIKYQINPALVRGFDYYCGLVFEYVCNNSTLLSQSTIIGGGQYHHRSLTFSNQNQTCFGFGLGIDRLILLLDRLNFTWPPAVQPDCYLVNLVDPIDERLIDLITALRQAGLRVQTNWKTFKLNQHFKLTDQFQPRYLLIFGPREQANDTIIIRQQTDKSQASFKLNNHQQIINAVKGS